MAFVVETGDGLTDSNAYSAVAEVDTYHTDRGNTKWTGSNGVKQSAIIRATDYIEKRFGKRFRGVRRTKEQSLQWPRINAYDDADYMYDFNEVPEKLKQATAEYALRALLLGELAPDIPPNVPGMNNATGSTTTEITPSGSITAKKEVVGPLEEETHYEARDAGYNTRAAVSDLLGASSIPEYPAADLLLEELIRRGSDRRIVRA